MVLVPLTIHVSVLLVISDTWGISVSGLAVWPRISFIWSFCVTGGKGKLLHINFS